MRRWIAVAAGLGFSTAAWALPWPLIATGEQCMDLGGGTVTCDAQGWGFGAGGGVQTADGHVGTWTYGWGSGYVFMTFEEDLDGDGYIDYRAEYSGFVDLASRCVTYGTWGGSGGSGWWSACL